jgi:hypothetical protein
MVFVIWVLLTVEYEVQSRKTFEKRYKIGQWAKQDQIIEEESL